MKKLVIKGGNPLHGTVTLGGAKNSGYKLIIAALLSDEVSTLTNVTPIGDIELIVNLLTSIGVKVTHYNEHCFVIDPKEITSSEVPAIYGSASRASLLLAGPLLARFKQATLPLPGGDRIGTSRDIDRHLEGLETLGVLVKEENGLLILHTEGLVGGTYRFKKVTHGGTENLILCSVLAKGKTILENCALEPEVDDLIEFLNAMGAKIIRKEDRVIEIEGVERLHGTVHRIMPDRNQAVTYALAAILTGGDIIIEDIKSTVLTSFLEKLDQAGGGYEVGEYGIRFFSKGSLKATKIETMPHPGFMSDWQPLWATFMTQAQGRSEIIERIYDNRFQYVDVLNNVGAKITSFDPKPNDPDEYYYFNYSAKSNQNTGIYIEGPTQLQPIAVPVWDIRYGATLLLASLTIKETSELTQIEHIQRGYYKIDERLRSLGADISLVEA
jgi:UDP-N-acetylglucosamine 1-carboxyvinyltransferase